MLSVAVINVSAPHYNLGARKLADWLATQGDHVAYHEDDPGLFGGAPTQVYLSVIFSWQAPLAAELAWRFKPHADVFCGGPGMFALGRWWQQQMGLTCHGGLDWRFERQRGRYRMTFASRGCPVNCHFCLVPRVEGTTFTLDGDFVPAPILCDNNLSALPVDFQQHIIGRYQETGTPLRDANSGFEPQTFDAETYRRWKPLLRGPWRLAFDTLDEAPAVQRMLQILVKEPARKKQVYVLIGNEPIAACYARAQQVIAWGGEPYVQPLLPLNALRRGAYKVAYDWDVPRLRAMQRYYNRHLWRAIPLRAYRQPRSAAPLFAQL
jgi:pyruvate-formate lyase-activating enzyme